MTEPHELKWATEEQIKEEVERELGWYTEAGKIHTLTHYDWATDGERWGPNDDQEKTWTLDDAMRDMLTTRPTDHQAEFEQKSTPDQMVASGYDALFLIEQRLRFKNDVDGFLKATRSTRKLYDHELGGELDWGTLCISMTDFAAKLLHQLHPQQAKGFVQWYRDDLRAKLDDQDGGS
jgi:hypothetical protein